MENEEWKMAKDWVISTGIKPMTTKPLENIVDLFDFAQSLRDGVILCQIINRLKPGTIVDFSEVSNIQMHLFHCLRNIRAFLSACKNTFKFEQRDLFQAQDLYDATNFKAVINTLAKLSNTYEAISICKLQPFSPENGRSHNKSDEEDIYGTLPDILEKKETIPYYNYHPVEENIYDHVQADESIYDDIINVTRKRQVTISNDKRGHIINEIIETEQNYLAALKTMIESYMKPLKGAITTDDKDIIFMNTEQIYYLHVSFSRDFKDPPSNNAKLNLHAFKQYKDKFTLYAMYCTDLPEAQQRPSAGFHCKSNDWFLYGSQQLKWVTELCKDTGFKERIERCNQKTGRKFGLQEQLAVPFQRILKYPLLLRDLNKQTPNIHEEKNVVEQALEAMDDIAKYINEYKRDAENVNTLSKIEASMKYDLNGQGVKPNQFGKPMRNGELLVKFDTNDRRPLKRVGFLFEHTLLLCKSRSDTYDVKEIFDLRKFQIGVIQPTGKGKFSQGWSMQASVSDGVVEAKNCIMLAKSPIEKDAWFDDITKCIKAVTLSEFQGKLDRHSFELTTFDSATSCSVCGMLLRGQISQGYKCMITGCGSTLHKECLCRCHPCNPTPARPTKPKPIRTTPTGKSSSFHGSKSMDQYEDQVLKTFTLPPSPGNPSSPDRTLDKFPWFAGVLSRDEAAQILCNYFDGAFLVRESPNQPGLALSIRYKHETKHIKVTSNNNRYYITDPKQFPSVAELIHYYKNNSLGSSFPTLPTKLTRGVGKPIKKTLIAKFSWQARNDKEISFFAGDRVNVLHDDGNWWFGECNGMEGFFPKNYVE